MRRQPRKETEAGAALAAGIRETGARLQGAGVRMLRLQRLQGQVGGRGAQVCAPAQDEPARPSGVLPLPPALPEVRGDRGLLTLLLHFDALDSPVA